VFSLKGPRFAPTAEVLAEAGDSVKRFYDSACRARRPPRSGALQFAPTKKFDEARFRQVPGMLRESWRPQPAPCGRGAARQFCRARFWSFVRQVRNTRGVRRARQVSRDSRRHRRFRLCAAAKGHDEAKNLLSAKAARRWAKRLQLWAGGGEPADLRGRPTPAKKSPRDVFAYVIHEGKVRAPAGAMELSNGEVTVPDMARAKKLFTIGYEQTPPGPCSTNSNMPG